MSHCWVNFPSHRHWIRSSDHKHIILSGIYRLQQLILICYSVLIRLPCSVWNSGNGLRLRSHLSHWSFLSMCLGLHTFIRHKLNQLNRLSAVNRSLPNEPLVNLQMQWCLSLRGNGRISSIFRELILWQQQQHLLGPFKHHNVWKKGNGRKQLI